MAEKTSDRVARHQKQAEHFQNLAEMEAEPRAREQLLGLAREYRFLADMPPRKPSAELLGTGARNGGDNKAVSRVDDRPVRES